MLIENVLLDKKEGMKKIFYKEGIKKGGSQIKKGVVLFSNYVQISLLAEFY